MMNNFFNGKWNIIDVQGNWSTWNCSNIIDYSNTSRYFQSTFLFLVAYISICQTDWEKTKLQLRDIMFLSSVAKILTSYCNIAFDNLLKFETTYIL